MSEFNISTDSEQNKILLNIQGDITGESESTLKNHFTNELSEQKDVILDFENVNYINSAGIATIISMMRLSEEKKIRMLIARPSKHVQKVIETVGLNDFLKIYDSLESALQA